jgi:DNA-binding IclR family transcriptional regulator
MTKTKAKAKAPRRSNRTSDDSLPSHGIRSITVGVTLLKAIAALGRPAALSEIARNAGISASRANRYLLGLISNKLVTRNAITGRYDLGPEIVELGVAALGRIDAVRLGIDALAILTERTQLASVLVVWGTNGPTVIRWEQGDLSSAVRVREGRALTLLRSSSGRVFLAYNPPALTKPFVEKEMLQWNANHPASEAFTWTKVDELRAEVRKSGLARGRGEENPHLDGLAAPVFDINGRLAYALALVSVAGSFKLGDNDPAALALKAITSELSHNLGAPSHLKARAW